jgi:hypothetical protein
MRTAKLSRRIPDIDPQNRVPLQLLTNSVVQQAQQFDKAGKYGRAAAMFREVPEISPNTGCAQQHSLLSSWRS